MSGNRQFPNDEMTNSSRIENLKTKTAHIGLLLNPKGGQATKRSAAIQNVLTKIPDVIVREASNAIDFKTALDHLLQADIDLLVIVAGDGTIHAALSHLFTTYPTDKWPVLLLVPGGTTNMTSLDLGILGKPDQVLERLKAFLLQPSNPTLITRPTLCIEQTGSNKIYGMFFGIGLIARGVKFSRSSIKQSGITGGIFTILIMLRSLIGMLFGKHQSEWAPVELTTTESDGKTHKKNYLFALVSALDCLLLDLRPYWGTENAPLHVTLVDQQRKRFWRSLWPLLSGRGHTLKAQDGYFSHNTHSLEFLMDDEYIIDGELYQANSQNGPIRISATEPVTFLVV